MKRLADILKEAMTPGFEKAFASTPKGVEVHMKHKESGEIHKQKFIGTHSAVAAAKKHIDAMQKKGYTVHAKKLIEEVEEVEEAKAMKSMSDDQLKAHHADIMKKINDMGGVSANHPLAQKARTVRTVLAMKNAGGMTKEEVEDVEEAMSHQAKTTMKHVANPTAGEKKAAKDIKPGTSGYSDRYAMLQSAKARGALKEDLLEILREMAKRGRPKKNPAPMVSPKKKMDDDEEDDEPDTGPEADKNITVQLKKAADQAVHGEKGGADVEFADGKKHFVHGHVAHTVLKAMEKMKPAQRAEAQKGIQQSHTHLMTVHKMLSGK